jgi:hypothetical protein
MKTNMNTTDLRSNQFPVVEKSAAGTSTLRLSENAFYLIVLAALLRDTIGSGRLKEILLPGRFVGLENPNQ